MASTFTSANTQYTIPDNAQLFTDLNGGDSVYYRQGNNLYDINLSQLGMQQLQAQNPTANFQLNGPSGDAQRAAGIAYLKDQLGIDVGSLSQYNLADAIQSIDSSGGSRSSMDFNSFKNLISSPTVTGSSNIDIRSQTGGSTSNQTITTPSGAQVTVPTANSKVPASGATPQGVTAVTNNGGNQPAQAPTGQNTSATVLTPPSVVLQPGSADAANVGKLQDYLVSLGLMNPQDLLNGGRGIYGPKTTAAVAALQSALGVDNSTGVGYFGPKTISALASAQGNKASGSSASSTETANTGTPTTPNTANGLSPMQNVQDVYTKLYADSGLSTIKSQYEATLKQQQDLTNEMNDKIAAVRSNPWYSQSEADRLAKNIQDKYSVKLDTLSHFATLYETMYKDGLDEIQFRVGLAEKDIQRAFDAAQKRQDALDKLAQADIHPGTVNGHSVLIDYRTKQVVADFGPEKASTGGQPVSGYNGEFAATIKLAAQQGGTNDQRAQMERNLQEFIANRDYASAYASIVDATARGLTGPSKTDFQQRTVQLETTAALKNALQALADAGYNTNLLTGTANNIQTKLGVLSTDPKYAAVANQVNLAFQDYRQKMTGAAFGQKESSEYASVLPSASNTLALNLAKIQGLDNYLNSVSDGYIKQIVGQGGIEIKAYANGATQASTYNGIVLPN